MSEISFKIHSLFCGVEKGVIENRENLFISTMGVKDDYHQDKHIILTDINTINTIAKQKEIALCLPKFYAHIISDQALSLEVGDYIVHKDISLIVRQCGKNCHMNEGCEYFNTHGSCELNTNVYYLESESQGEININETWRIMKCIDMP